MLDVFRSTRVVTPDGVMPANVQVEDGRILGIDEWGEIPRDANLNEYGDLVLLPGMVDTHVHINEPGRTEWEGFSTATRAAAAGGVTTLVDMPLNCLPEITHIGALEAKRQSSQGKCWVDWAAWGGVVRNNLDDLTPLISAGVPGFKCFMIDSGVEGFAWVGEADLRNALKRLRGTGLPLLAHAEAPGPVASATQALNHSEAQWRSYATYLSSRPDSAEVEAIALLIRLAEEFRTPVHIVHLSSALALPLLVRAKQSGIPVTVETCAHYLWFAAEEIPDGATPFKCAPPIRSTTNREQLWTALAEGIIDMVATDHSPCPPAMKHLEEGHWNRAWGGIASLGLALPVVWTGMLKRGLGGDPGLARIATWLATAPARLAGMSTKKGAIQSGADADFAVFDPDAEWTIGESDLHFRHNLSPYLGEQVQGRILETWLRGRRVYSNGTFEGRPMGQEWVGR